MPLLRTETIFGNVCKFYDNGTVMVGTTAAKRFSVRLLATDDVPARLEAELKKRGLWSTGKLPEDEEATAEQLDDSELQAESGQPAAKPSVLFGSSRNALVLPRNERGLASDLGGAWELGQPLHRAEGEMHEISRANGMLYLERCAAKEATKKRCLEEAALAADAKEPCLCTPAGANALMRESLQLTREALALVENRRLATAQPATASPAGTPVSTPPVSTPPTTDEPPAA